MPASFFRVSTSCLHQPRDGVDGRAMPRAFARLPGHDGDCCHRLCVAIISHRGARIIAALECAGRRGAMTIAIRFGWIRLPMLVAGIGMASVSGGGADACCRSLVINPLARGQAGGSSRQAAEATTRRRQRRRRHEGHRRQQAGLEPAQGRRFARSTTLKPQEGRTAQEHGRQ